MGRAGAWRGPGLKDGSVGQPVILCWMLSVPIPPPWGQCPGQARVTAHDPTGGKPRWRTRWPCWGWDAPGGATQSPSAGGQGPEGTRQPLPGHLLHGAGVCERVQEAGWCWPHTLGPRGGGGRGQLALATVGAGVTRRPLVVSGLLAPSPTFLFYELFLAGRPRRSRSLQRGVTAEGIWEGEAAHGCEGGTDQQERGPCEVHLPAERRPRRPTGLTRTQGTEPAGARASPAPSLLSQAIFRGTTGRGASPGLRPPLPEVWHGWPSPRGRRPVWGSRAHGTGRGWGPLRTREQAFWGSERRSLGGRRRSPRSSESTR